MVTGSKPSKVSPTTALNESVIGDIERALHEADPSAFAVPPRIVRRVIRHEVDLPELSARVPHRKCFVTTGERVRHVVANDELGVESGVALPQTVILLARPEEHDLEAMSEFALREHYRRLHFHARVHVVLDSPRAKKALEPAGIRQRIDQIGRTAFEEIRAVLRHEAFLLPPVSDASVYAEFAALFLELRFFEPDLLPVYFPSLDDIDRIESVISQDVDPLPLLQLSRDFAGEPASQPAEDPAGGDTSFDFAQSRQILSPLALSRARRSATSAAAKGNDVRAAILHSRIAASSSGEPAAEAAALAAEDLKRLTCRLQSALGLNSEAVEGWRDFVSALLPQATFGFWNPAARLLYDLQKVCLDFERTTYVIDLGAWLRSFGRRRMKRALPAQREVRMSKHLRGASARLSKVRLPDGRREQFAALLHEATEAAEVCLRQRLRPTVDATMLEVGFRPQNVPEQVAFRKIVEELLDAVVERGFFGMGDIRDSVARNNLKLDDVASVKELFVGDCLLRADRRLADVLDGVYVRGAFYLRWLQRLSSLAFGTRPGRFFTLYAAIPFGGAYLLLSFLDHLVFAVEQIADGSYFSEPTHVLTEGAHPEPHVSQLNLATTPSIVILGLLILAVTRHEGFREMAWRGLRLFGRALRAVLVEFPKWVANQDLVRRFLHSVPVVFFRKRLLTSLVLTLMVTWALPLTGWYARPTGLTMFAVFVAFAVILNSRAGRDIEEVATEQMQQLWHRIRVHVFVALFDLIMDSFKRVLEWLERILYEVDEWLRFQSGQSTLMLAAKATLGLIWSVVRFFLRFFVTVLIEPQVNPIKHFPVVTVSHKVLFPLAFGPLSKSLERFFDSVRAKAITTTTLFLVPGAFGFLVWELRANWRLYAVNRRRGLHAVPVGRHGETMLRLLRPGIHSGTQPKLYSRLRRAARRTQSERRVLRLIGFYGKLRQVETDVRYFFEREFLRTLDESHSFRGIATEIEGIELGTQSIRVGIAAPQLGDDALWLGLEQRSGRMIAGIWKPGWVARLSREQRSALAGLLVGFYRDCGIDVVREQLAAQLGPLSIGYEVAEAGLVLQTQSQQLAKNRAAEVEPAMTIPWVAGSGARSPASLEPDVLVFQRSETLWTDWIAAWSQEALGSAFPDLPPLHPSTVTLP